MRIYSREILAQSILIRRPLVVALLCVTATLCPASGAQASECGPNCAIDMCARSGRPVIRGTVVTGPESYPHIRVDEVLLEGDTVPQAAPMQLVSDYPPPTVGHLFYHGSLYSTPVGTQVVAYVASWNTGFHSAFALTPNGRVSCPDMGLTPSSSPGLSVADLVALAQQPRDACLAQVVKAGYPHIPCDDSGGCAVGAQSSRNKGPMLWFALAAVAALFARKSIRMRQLRRSQRCHASHIPAP